TRSASSARTTSRSSRLSPFAPPRLTRRKIAKPAPRCQAHRADARALGRRARAAARIPRRRRVRRRGMGNGPRPRRRAPAARPADREAVIGPAIAGCCYEVGAEVADAFRARTGDATAPAWTRRDSCRHLDLRIAARRLLEAARVRSVTVLGPCTACGPGYHS